MKDILMGKSLTIVRIKCNSGNGITFFEGLSSVSPSTKMCYDILHSPNGKYCMCVEAHNNCSRFMHCTLRVVRLKENFGMFSNSNQSILVAKSGKSWGTACPSFSCWKNFNFQKEKFKLGSNIRSYWPYWTFLMKLDLHIIETDCCWSSESRRTWTERVCSWDVFNKLWPWKDCITCLCTI